VDDIAELTALVTSLRKGLPLRARLVSGAHHGIISAVAGVIAYVPTRALGLSEGFWSAITAIGVVQAEFRATQTTARDQLLGAAIGGLVALSAMVVFGPHLIVYTAAVLVTMMVCWALNMASASRLAGVTATIILLVPHSDSAVAMFLSRVTEVGWGVLVAVSVVWLAARLPARWWLRS